MPGDPHPLRVVLELHRGEGSMSGRVLAEGQTQPQSFTGWLELLALLESACPPADRPTDPQREDEQ